MKRILSFTLCLLLCAVMFTLPVSAVEKVTITYDLMYNGLTMTETINKGSVPWTEQPEREGYEFFGYYADPACTQPYDIGAPQYQDVTVYVRWVAEEDIIYISLYLHPDDEDPVASASGVKGEAYGQPVEPAVQGMVFAGWYLNKACSVAYNPTQNLYNDTDLYACFVSSQSEVTGYNVFDSPDADYPVVGGYIRRGGYMFIPNDPDMGEDELLLGWYTDRELTTPFNAAQPVTSEFISLYPKVVSEDDVYWIGLYLNAQDEYPISYGCNEKGSPIPQPDDPGRDDFTFGGWYFDSALTQPADFSTPWYTDASLYPRWDAVHNHTLTEIAEVPATAVTDGYQSYLVCDVCGKRFYNMASALIEVEDPESLVIPATGPFLTGDANGDGKVNVNDVTDIQRFLAQVECPRFCRAAANVISTDGLNISDVTKIQRYLAEFITSL